MLPPLSTRCLTRWGMNGVGILSLQHRRPTDFTHSSDWTARQMGRWGWGRNCGGVCSGPRDSVDARQLEGAFGSISSNPLPLGSTQTRTRAHTCFSCTSLPGLEINQAVSLQGSKANTAASIDLLGLFSQVFALLYNNRDDSPSQNLYFTLWAWVFLTVKWE